MPAKMSQTGYKGTPTNASQFGHIAVPAHPAPGVRTRTMAGGGAARPAPPARRPGGEATSRRWAGQDRPCNAQKGPFVSRRTPIAGAAPGMDDAVARIGPHKAVNCPRLADNGQRETLKPSCSGTWRWGHTRRVVNGRSPRVADTDDDCRGNLTFPVLQIFHLELIADTQ